MPTWSDGYGNGFLYPTDSSSSSLMLRFSNEMEDRFRKLECKWFPFRLGSKCALLLYGTLKITVMGTIISRREHYYLDVEGFFIPNDLNSLQDWGSVSENLPDMLSNSLVQKWKK
jgi:hypothetical protein